MKIRELLIDESKWIQGDWARNISNNISSPTDIDACKWCLFGAIFKCYEYSYERKRILELIQKKVDEDIVVWNDALGRTFDDVSHLLEELDI